MIKIRITPPDPVGSACVEMSTNAGYNPDAAEDLARMATDAFRECFGDMTDVVVEGLKRMGAAAVERESEE